MAETKRTIFCGAFAGLLLVMDNKEGLFKPDTYVNAEITLK